MVEGLVAAVQQVHFRPVQCWVVVLVVVAILVPQEPRAEHQNQNEISQGVQSTNLTRFVSTRRLLGEVESACNCLHRWQSNQIFKNHRPIWRIAMLGHSSFFLYYLHHFFLIFFSPLFIPETKLLCSYPAQRLRKVSTAMKCNTHTHTHKYTHKKREKKEKEREKEDKKEKKEKKKKKKRR